MFERDEKRFDVYEMTPTGWHQLVFHSPRWAARKYARGFNKKSRGSTAVVVVHGIVPRVIDAEIVQPVSPVE